MQGMGQTSWILGLAIIVVLIVGMSAIQPAEAKKASGTLLLRTMAGEVCGLELCDKPMSIKEKIAAFLQGSESTILQQAAIRKEMSIRQFTLDDFCAAKIPQKGGTTIAGEQYGSGANHEDSQGCAVTAERKINASPSALMHLVSPFLEGSTPTPKNFDLFAARKTIVISVDVSEITPLQYSFPTLNAQDKSAMIEEFEFGTGGAVHSTGMSFKTNYGEKGRALQNSDFTIQNTLEGIPESLGIFKVEPGSIEFPQNPKSSTSSRAGLKSPDNSLTPIYEPWTFGAHGNQDETKKSFEAFQKAGQGNPLRGSITINIVDPKDNYQTIHSFELHECTLLSYSPFGSLNVDDPTTLTFEFTVVPGYIKIQ